MILALAIKSLRNRKLTVALTVLSIALAMFMLLGVERIRQEARESFASTVSGTDLIVGARSSPIHLLLYAVFRIGNPTNNVSWDSYRHFAADPKVAWTIPLVLGDSHRGFRVLGTTPGYFEHFRFARGRGLEFAEGRPLHGESDAVLGADVARRLGYTMGQSIVIAHGAGDVSFEEHKDHPFRVTGILARTGTPVDQTIHVTLTAMDAVHAEAAAAADSFDPLAAALHAHDEDGAESKRTISAILVGLKSRAAALSFQRGVNQYAGEPLTAILPALTLQELWDMMGAVERTLFAVSSLVVVVGLAGMLVALLTGLSERRREMAILRSVGARPAHVFALIMGEATFLTLCGIACGVAVLYLALLIGQVWLQSRLGLLIAVGWPSMHELQLMLVVAVAGILIGLIPAYRIYRYSLADGMTIRV